MSSPNFSANPDNVIRLDWNDPQSIHDFLRDHEEWSPLFDGEGKLTGVECTTEIAEVFHFYPSAEMREQAIEAMRQAAPLIEQLLEAQPELTWMLAPDWREILRGEDEEC